MDAEKQNAAHDASTFFGHRIDMTPNPITPPITCMSANIGHDSGAIPAKELENIRPKPTAGFAMLVDEVNQ
jgi:hypothetical protein